MIIIKIKQQKTTKNQLGIGYFIVKFKLHFFLSKTFYRFLHTVW